MSVARSYGSHSRHGTAMVNLAKSVVNTMLGHKRKSSSSHHGGQKRRIVSQRRTHRRPSASSVSSAGSSVSAASTRLPGKRVIKKHWMLY